MKGKKQTHPPAGKQKWTYSNSSWYPAFSNGLSLNKGVTDCQQLFQKKDYNHKTRDISGSTPHVTRASTNEKPLPVGAHLSSRSLSLRTLCFSMHLMGYDCHFQTFFMSLIFLMREISHRVTNQNNTNSSRDWPWAESWKGWSSPLVSPIHPASALTFILAQSFLLLRCLSCILKKFALRRLSIYHFRDTRTSRGVRIIMTHSSPHPEILPKLV